MCLKLHAPLLPLVACTLVSVVSELNPVSCLHFFICGLVHALLQLTSMTANCWKISSSSNFKLYVGPRWLETQLLSLLSLNWLQEHTYPMTFQWPVAATEQLSIGGAEILLAVKSFNATFNEVHERIQQQHYRCWYMEHIVCEQATVFTVVCWDVVA